MASLCVTVVGKGPGQLQRNQYNNVKEVVMGRDIMMGEEAKKMIHEK